ncbi:MAG: hypothetical protein OXG69_03630 [bacterium]|nr:hypothetical protein [bacterium]
MSGGANLKESLTRTETRKQDMALSTYPEIVAAAADGDIANLRRVVASSDAAGRLRLLSVAELPDEIIEEILAKESPALTGVDPKTASYEHEALSRAEVDSAAHSLVRRIALARMPKAPPESLAALAGDVDTDVRAAVAAHPATPPAVLRELLRDGSGEVWLALAENPALPSDVAEDLVEGKWEYEGAIDYTPYVWERLAENPSLTPTMLASLAIEACYSYESLVAIVANANTPASTLAALTRNGCPIIAAAAAKELAVRAAAPNLTSD